MRLSSKDRSVLVAVQLDADVPVSRISERTGLPTHTVHYHLRRLRDQGVLVRWPFINVDALGYTKYEIFFSFAAEKETDRQRLIQRLSQSNRVAWFSELGGNYQYSMTICAETIAEVSDFLDSLTSEFGNVFFKKSVCALLTYAVFRKKYLDTSQRNLTPSVVQFQPTSVRASLDDTDYRIISALYDPEYNSLREMAKRLGLARSTVEYRIKKLFDNRVLLRNIYAVRTTQLGISLFKLLIFVTGLRQGFKDSLFDFCVKHPNVVNYSHCIGSWDFEIGIEVENRYEIAKITQELYSRFGTDISDVQVLPIFKEGYSRNFLKILKTDQDSANYSKNIHQ